MDPTGSESQPAPASIIYRVISSTTSHAWRGPVSDLFNALFLSLNQDPVLFEQSTPTEASGQRPNLETPRIYSEFLTFGSFCDNNYGILKESFSCMDAAGRVTVTRLRTQGGRLSA